MEIMLQWVRSTGGVVDLFNADMHSMLMVFNGVSKVLPAAISWENVNTSVECWATDAASFANGKTYFYLSVGPKQVGVVSGDSPTGPFKDPIGKPLVPIGMVKTYVVA